MRFAVCENAFDEDVLALGAAVQAQVVADFLLS